MLLYSDYNELADSSKSTVNIIQIHNSKEYSWVQFKMQ